MKNIQISRPRAYLQHRPAGDPAASLQRARSHLKHPPLSRSIERLGVQPQLDHHRLVVTRVPPPVSAQPVPLVLAFERLAS